MRVGELRERLAYVPADSVIAVPTNGEDGIFGLDSVEISKVSENHQVVYLMPSSETPEL